MVPKNITMLDKGYQSHFPDVTPDEKIMMYCIAYIYPVSSLKNAEYWCLITDKKFRLSRRKNTLMALLSEDDYICININEIFAKDEKFAFNCRIQFYRVGDAPQKARSPIAVGGIIEAIINGLRPPMVLLHFKSKIYEEILNCFRELGQLAE